VLTFLGDEAEKGKLVSDCKWERAGRVVVQVRMEMDWKVFENLM